MLPGNRVLATLQKGKSATDRDLMIFMASRETGLAWANSGRTHTDLGLALLTLAQREVGGGARYRELLGQSIHSLREGLARAPANPYAWTRLAFATLEAGEPGRRVAPMLDMALRAGPVEPTLVFPRLELCFIAWPYIDQSDHALLNEQMRLAWRQSGDRLVRLARALGRVDAAREALTDEDRVEFDRRLTSQK
jgi:hypothetical protein